MMAIHVTCTGRNGTLEDSQIHLFIILMFTWFSSYPLRSQRWSCPWCPAVECLGHTGVFASPRHSNLDPPPTCEYAENHLILNEWLFLMTHMFGLTKGMTVITNIYEVVSQHLFLTLLSCVCGRSASRGFSRSCVWLGSDLGGRLRVSLQFGPVCHTERAQLNSSKSIHHRSRHYWLTKEKVKARI